MFHVPPPGSRNSEISYFMLSFIIDHLSSLHLILYLALQEVDRKLYTLYESFQFSTNCNCNLQHENMHHVIMWTILGIGLSSNIGDHLKLIRKRPLNLTRFHVVRCTYYLLSSFSIIVVVGRRHMTHDALLEVKDVKVKVLLSLE